MAEQIAEVVEPPVTPAEALAEAVQAVVEAAPPDPIAAAKAEAEAAKASALRAEKMAEKLKERINKVTAELKKAQEGAAKPPPPTAGSPEDLQRQIEERASSLADARASLIEFNRETGKVLSSGKKAFPDFLEKVEAFKSAALDASDPQGPAKYQGIVSAIMEAAEGDYGVSAKIIHALGEDPERAEELAKMSPTRLGSELAKLASAEPPEAISRAPKAPSAVVGGRGVASLPIDPTDPARASKLSMADWMARRNADVKTKREAGVRGLR